MKNTKSDYSLIRKILPEKSINRGCHKNPIEKPIEKHYLKINQDVVQSRHRAFILGLTGSMKAIYWQ